MAQLVKCLLDKQENLCLIPWNTWKKMSESVLYCYPIAKEVETGESSGFLTSYSSWICEIQVLWENLLYKVRRGEIEEDTQHQHLTYTPARKHGNMYAHTKEHQTNSIWNSKGMHFLLIPTIINVYSRPAGCRNWPRLFKLLTGASEVKDGTQHITLYLPKRYIQAESSRSMGVVSFGKVSLKM